MKKTKQICIILIISILVSMFILPDMSLMTVNAADDSDKYYENGYFPIFYDENNKNIFESIKDNLPTGTKSTITVNGSIFPFNYRLWFAKNIIVYGDYSTANPRSNDFKAETDSPHDVGYYSKNGVRGEYRYHGFDIAGNRYNNTWWTIDVDTGSSINDNVWLYRPWDDKTYRLENISPYNQAAEWPRNQEDQYTRDWINRPIQKDGAPLTFENAEIANEREAYRYIHIMSPPTINYPGEGKAWHKHNNLLLYRTFTIDTLDHVDKLMTDVATTVKILTPKEKLTVYDFGPGSSGNTPEYLDSEIEVEVEVSGTLLDEDYFYDPVKKIARYTREDIKDWTISLGKDNIQDNVKSVDYNKGKAIFTLKYKVASILAQNSYVLNGNARVNFKNDKSNENTGSTNLVFEVERKVEPAGIPKDKLMTDVNSALEVLVSPEMLTIQDYGENNTQEYLNGVVTVPVRVTGTLMDSTFYNNPEEREKRYNRDDIHSWTMSLNDETYNGIEPDSYHKNIGDAVITLRFKRSDILQQQTWQLSSYAESVFLDGEKSKGTATGNLTFIIEQAPQNQEPPSEPPPETIEEPAPPPAIIEPNCYIPHPGFDIVPYPAYDSTDLSKVLSRKVYINGDEVNDVEFFSGNYIFGDGNDGIKKIDVTYESIDGITTSTTQWAYIYDTKPTAQFKLEGTFKENRKLTATENCDIGNTQIVLNRYPIVSYEWKFATIDGESSSLKQRTLTSDKYREFLYKKPGVYKLELTVTNTLGRVSKPYILEFVIYEDTPPAIEMNIWNGVLTRGEELKLHYSTSSVDKDTIASKTLQLFYDSNNDGVCDQLIKTFTNGEFTGYEPDKLGKYKLVATATEEFGQETLSEFITAADKKKKILESEFWVDNLIPMTDIYVNVPVVKPEIDMYIMMDKNLNDAKKQYITGNRINFNNFLRTKNILPKIETWDMKTYQYSQTTSDTRYTGESYPSSSISYSSGGYSGTLYLDRFVDNGEYRDFGRYETRTESKEFTRTHSNTVTKTYWDDKLTDTTESNPAPSSKHISEDGYSGNIPKVGTYGPYNYRVFEKYYGSREFTRTHSNTVTDYYYGGSLLESTNSSPAPTSKYINEDGYSGYIYRTGTNGPYNRKEGYTYYMGYICWYVQQTFEAVYCGSLEKLKSYKTSEDYESTYRGTLTKSIQVWVPDMRWVNDYIGYYSGTVYKDVRQPYTNPFRATSDKYVVYISDGSVNELSDLKMVMSKADAGLILVGGSTIKNQISHDHYISKDKPIDTIMQEVLDYIAVNSPAVEKHYVLAGIDTFDIKTMDFDEENDPIVERKYQYVQNQNYFDNPTGMESFAAVDFSEDSNWTDTKVSKFNKVGEFRIFKRIKDMPSTDPNFTNYSYYSGTPELRVYAHRKPIARATLDWDYDSNKGVYKTRWVCQSYDLDHQYSREDKGIADRKIMFRRAGGEWYYYIPEELTPGTYELQYYVKDIEGVWSEPFAMNFTLASAPTIQLLDAKLRTQDPGFSLDGPDGIPASEYLEVYDVWTRYPYNVKLEMALYNGNTRISPLKIVNYSSVTGVKTDNDIRWNNISYRVPSTVADGTYTFKIEAIDIDNSNIFDEKSFTVTVNTPINLVPSMPETAMTEITIDVKAITTKYATTTRVILFHGEDESFQKTLELTGLAKDNTKEWMNTYTIPSNIPEGIYTASFTAITPSGKSETKDIQFRVETLKITEVTIEGYWNHWRGQVDMFDPRIILTNEPHRFLSLERVKINIHTDGYADRIEIRFSPELEAMQFRDVHGNTYDYLEDFGFQYVSFPKIFILDSAEKENDTYWEYVLPLAESTKSWDNTRLKNPYKMEVTAWKGTKSVKYVIDDIDVTGNIYDLTYIQPIN